MDDRYLAPTRKVETELTGDFQSLNTEPLNFRDDCSTPTSSLPVEEAQPRAPPTQAQPPQRSESSSSAESYEQLQAALETAGSEFEELAICKQYIEEHHRKYQKSEAENQRLELAMQEMTEGMYYTRYVQDRVHHVGMHIILTVNGIHISRDGQQ